MSCILPDLTEEQNAKIQKILTETGLMEDIKLTAEICNIQTSKKNIVVSIHPSEKPPFVLKLFSSPKFLNTEMKIYTKIPYSIFHETKYPFPVQYAIPTLLHRGDDFLITKYIDGFNGMDIITKNVQSEWKPVFWEQICTDLIQWILNFTELTHFVPTDCHIRNFILVESTIFGVDFEELGEDTYENLIHVFVTLYFSILGAYPGVIEGLELEKKAKIGSIFLRSLLLAPKFQHKSINEFLSEFVVLLREEAAIVVQRRLNLKRGKGYNTLKIKENLDFVISHIQSDFD